MRGTYAIVFYVARSQYVRVGTLGDDIIITAGWWVYVGSAMGRTFMSLENRIRHHFAFPKQARWHIDYLLGTVGVATASVWAESITHDECRLSKALADSRQFAAGPRRFGASDCKAGCSSHLYKYLENREPIDPLIEIFAEIGLEPRVTLNSCIRGQDDVVMK